MGFKEAFTRGQEEEKNLLFDDDAFLYFAISMLTIIILPTTFSVLKPIFWDYLLGGETRGLKRAQSGENDRKMLEKVKAERRLQWLNKGYYFKVLVLVILLFLLKASINSLPEQNTIKGFDPYEILEVDPSATEQQIRSAFRKMSVKLHPDKNPDDPQAEQKFIMLTKAYECLTDETMKEKCLKYGNPDGNQAFQVGIALPSFLLKKENRTAFLAVIFLILLVFVPILVFKALSSFEKYDDNGVMRENMEKYEAFLNENLILRNCPRLLVATREISQLRARYEEYEWLMKVTNEMIEEAELKKIANFELTELKEKNKKNKRSFLIPKSIVLVFAHLLNKPIPQHSKADYDYMVRMAPKIFSSAAQYALQFSSRAQVERIKQFRRFTKFMGVRCCCTLLDFSQCMVQGLWEKDPSVFQLQFYRNESSKYMKRDKYPELIDFVSKPREQRTLPNYVPEEFRQQLNDEIDFFPRIKVSYTLEIEDETVTELTNEDSLLLKLSVDRENTPEGQDIPFVHSNRFTYLREETWHIFFVIGDDIFFYKKLNGSSKVQVAEMKFIPKQIFGDKTDIKFNAIIKSDSYKGLDQEITIQFKLSSIKDVNRTVTYHKDDEKLDKELPYIARMLNPMLQQEQNSEESESEPEDDGQENEKDKGNKTKKD